jgi:hypothetical protein
MGSPGRTHEHSDDEEYERRSALVGFLDTRMRVLTRPIDALVRRPNDVVEVTSGERSSLFVLRAKGYFVTVAVWVFPAPPRARAGRH